MLARALARRLRPPRARPASVLATAGLDADAADLFHAAADFAGRELAPHSARWDEDKVEEKEGGRGGGVVSGLAKKRKQPTPPFFSAFRTPPSRPPRPPASPP